MERGGEICEKEKGPAFRACRRGLPAAFAVPFSAKVLSPGGAL